MQELVKEIYTESIQAQIAAGEALPSALEAAAFTIVQSLINGNKVLCCGGSNNHMLAAHFANLLVNFYETERPCLPAIALSNELTPVELCHNRCQRKLFAPSTCLRTKW